jgi:diguanylate cyclase (GGDEF)-like protein
MHYKWCGCLDIFERIRINTQNNYFVTNEGDEVRFTISIGLAKYQSEDDINEVISKADSNLYEAKNRGRNNTVFEID